MGSTTTWESRQAWEAVAASAAALAAFTSGGDRSARRALIRPGTPIRCGMPNLIRSGLIRHPIPDWDRFTAGHEFPAAVTDDPGWPEPPDHPYPEWFLLQCG